MRKTIIAGNWKMNKTHKEAAATLKELATLVKDKENLGGVEVIIGAPFTALESAVRATEGTPIAIAAENMSEHEGGAYTGEISATMLKELGVEYVILGHSERRAMYGETDAIVNAKVKAALKSGLKPILCIGEQLEDRESGKTNEVNDTQLKGGLEGVTAEEMANVIVAYEPVWAIGTGKTATPEMAEETHAFVRSVLVELYGNDVAEGVTIQYGGSMKPGNAKELLAQKNIDGGLVGGAALEAESFYVIISAGK
jgi:triosephosphate isomerase